MRVHSVSACSLKNAISTTALLSDGTTQKYKNLIVIVSDTTATVEVGD